MKGIEIGDLGIFSTEQQYKDHIRRVYSLKPSDAGYNPVDSSDGKVWRVGNGLSDVPYLWTEEANEQLIKYNNMGEKIIEKRVYYEE